MKTKPTLSILIMHISFLASVYGGQIYHQFMDANWLMENAVFPSRTPLLVNGCNSILFEESGVIGRWFDVLIEVPLPDFGVLLNGTMFSIDIEAIPLPSKNPSYLDDEELHIGITDGINVVTFTRFDNDNGSGGIFEGTYDTPQAWLDTVNVLFGNAGRSATFSTIITLNDLETTVWGQIGSTSGSATAINHLSLTSQLHLVVIADNSWEEYQIHHIEIIIRPCNYYLVGDLDNDCDVDLEDFALMAANWLINCDIEPENPSCILLQ